MQLFGGIILFLVGILIIRGCIRDYRDNLGEALSDDLWDYFHGRTFGIVAGVFLSLLGAGMILLAFSPGSSLRFSSNFPFVTITRTSSPQP
jgi:hypothetical protein